LTLKDSLFFFPSFYTVNLVINCIGKNFAMNKLYIGNLNYSTTTAKLTELFGQFGKVVEVILPTDRQTGRLRGFGFVTMTDAQGAKAALAMNGTDVDGRSLRVNLADEDRRSNGSNGSSNSGWGKR
jgi:cold-inducible RNA-binding protein